MLKVEWIFLLPLLFASDSTIPKRILEGIAPVHKFSLKNSVEPELTEIGFISTRMKGYFAVPFSKQYACANLISVFITAFLRYKVDPKSLIL